MVSFHWISNAQFCSKVSPNKLSSKVSMKKVFFIRLCGRPWVYLWMNAKKCFGEMSVRTAKPESVGRITPTSMPKLSERISAYLTSRGILRYHGLARRASIFFLLINALLMADSLPVFANNLSITNISLEDRNSSLDTAIIEFDINWDNSWRNTTNHDAVWIFFKVTKSGTIYHGMMKDSGVDPADTSPGSNKDLEIYVPTDKMGAFIRRSSTGTGTVTSTDVRLKLDYAASPLSAADTDSITVQVIGIEMVFIPTTSFYAGDTTAVLAPLAAQAQLRSGSGTISPNNNPWAITSEATITTTSPGGNGKYYYITAGRPSEDVQGAIFSIPAAFPKGYAAFYCMKYEITEGQWVNFVNTLSSAAQSVRDITGNDTGYSAQGGKNADTVVNRNTIAQSGSGTSAASTQRPDRVCNYLSWEDLCAYLDWAGLRPMTELEFEKICRGPLSPVAGEYAWGSTNVTAAVTISISPELGLETISTANANYNLNGTTFSRGDDYLGATSAVGALRAGIFATSSSTREQAGASYYGAMEMSGNVYERVVTIGNSAGRAFTGLHGDGVLVSGQFNSDGSNADGNANVANWPHTDTQSATRGVNKADGAGFKGGGPGGVGGELRISDRNVAPFPDTTRASTYGGRGVKTYDGP